MLILLFILFSFALGNSSKTTIKHLLIMVKFSLSQFDFSGKRVRFNGKFQSKFGLSYLIGMFEPLSCYSIYPDAYPYCDYASKLHDLVLSKLS